MNILALVVDLRPTGSIVIAYIAFIADYSDSTRNVYPGLKLGHSVSFDIGIVAYLFFYACDSVGMIGADWRA